MKMVVMGAMGVGKTTIINILSRSFPAVQFVEICAGGGAKWRKRHISSKRVDMGIIVIEKNRFSMLFLENMISQFHKIPVVIIQMIYRLPSASIEQELAPFYQVIAQHNKVCLPLHIYNVEKCDIDREEYARILQYII